MHTGDGGLGLTTPPDENRIDPAIVATLYLDYGDDLRAFLIGVLRDRDAAAEVLQSTFTKALEAGHTVRRTTFKGWLFRVAYNEAMALRRRQKVYDKSIRKLAWQRTGEHEGPEDNLSRGETIARIRTALEVLSEEQRQVVRMRIYEEKTFAVIAEQLGLPLGTVLTRMRLALKKLQRRFDDDESPV
ncbi:MAG: RNA polymerase sigma factor [Planctomycetaceae bacterium]